jgi:uncharacterized protein YbjT (DUF2867 family)
MTRTILVTGATGYIGGRLVPMLLEAGYHVICLARDPSRLAGRRWKDVEVRQGDALNPEGLSEVLDGVDVSYYLIHSMAEGARGFEDRDRVAAQNFGAAARAAGVQQIVYLGGLGAGDRDLSAHLASRQEVGSILSASGVPVTEFRAAVIVGAGSMSFEMIRYLTERLPVMITPRWVTTRCQPIAIDDVLEYLVCCLAEPRAKGRTFEIGGPDVLTYGEMMLGYAAARGLRRYLISVPILTPRLSSYWVDLVTPIPASYSHPLIEGMRSEVVVHEPGAREVFTLEPMPYAEAVRRALDRTRSGEVETFWATADSPDSLKPGVLLTTTEGMIVEQRQVEIAASAQEIFATFSGIGGQRGWLFADWVWQARGLIDRLAGGVGMRRGRRHPDELRPGDALDFWRVEAVEPGRLIRLRAEMKLPGLAWLQFEARPRPAGGARLIQTAFFEPHGLAGLAYWYLLYPIHQLIFSGMAQAVARLTEQTPQLKLVDQAGA